MQSSQLRLGGTWRGQSYYADSTGAFLTPDFDPTGSDITVRVNNASSALTATITKRSASIYDLAFTPGTAVNVGDTVEILLNYTRSAVVETETFQILVLEAGASTSTRYNAIAAISGTSVTLDASAPTTANLYSNQLLKIGDEVRFITSYSTGRVATISHAFVASISAGAKYEIISIGPADVQLWRAGVPAALTSTFVNVTVAAMQSNVLGAAAIATGAFDTLKFTTAAINQFASNLSDAWNAGSYSFFGVNASITNYVKAAILAPGASPIVVNGTGGVTVGAMQIDTITSTALATSAVTEIQTGLMTSGGYTAPLDAAGTRSALGLGSANLDTQLGGIPAAVWAVGSRTLTGFGSLVADITAAVWGATTRTLSAFGFNVSLANNAITSAKIDNTALVSIAFATSAQISSDIDTDDHAWDIAKGILADSLWSHPTRGLTEYVTVEAIRPNVITGTSIDATGVTKIQAGLGTRSQDIDDREIILDLIETAQIHIEANATENRDAILNSIGDVETMPSITILPAAVLQSELQAGSRLRAFVRQRSPIMASVYGATGTTPLDLTGKTLQFVVDYADQTNFLTIANADISITGVDHNSFYFDPPDDLVAKSQLLNWSLRDSDGVLSSGELEILYAP